MNHPGCPYLFGFRTPPLPPPFEGGNEDDRAFDRPASTRTTPMRSLWRPPEQTPRLHMIPAYCLFTGSGLPCPPDALGVLDDPRPHRPPRLKGGRGTRYPTTPERAYSGQGPSPPWVNQTEPDWTAGTLGCASDGDHLAGNLPSPETARVQFWPDPVCFWVGVCPMLIVFKGIEKRLPESL